MTDPNRVHANFSSNIFLFIMEVMAKHKNATDEDIAMRYTQAQTTNAQYKASVDQWKGDAAQIPTAGFVQHHDATENINSTGIGTMLATAAVSLLAIGAALAFIGVGVALLVAAVAIGIIALEYTCPNKGSTDTVAAYDQYDPAKQAEVTNKVQLDQTEVQRLQSNLSQIMQQYIAPANDMKTQDANMIQAAMQWYKAMMWSQGAA